MNPNYNIIPCFVEENPKTTLKICVISKQNLWFSTTSTLTLLNLFKKKKKTPYFILFSFLFSRTFPLLNHPKSHHYDPKQHEFKIQINKVP